jgi:hypothetical protein
MGGAEPTSPTPQLSASGLAVRAFRLLRLVAIAPFPLIVLERIRRLPVSKMHGGQKPEQYRAGDGSGCNHIDQVSRGHR